MPRLIISRVLIALLSVALTLLALELAARLIGQTDSDGQFHYLGFTLPAADLPVNQLRVEVEGYLANKDIANVIYDENTGWAYRPQATRQGGSFTINSAGFRSQRDYALEPAADTLRIAVFGDSFTAGDDVADEQTWAWLLERELNERGIAAEVLNFGVGGYGMGQAFLRWRELGRQFAPDIVIFGLQPENLQRNVNVFRQLLHNSGPAFSKPRFALIDGELQLLNMPTIPPEQLLDVFANFSHHPLARYEYHYQNRDRAARWWAGSRLLSLVFAALRQEEDAGIYAPGSEGGELGKAIIDAFAADAAQAGAHFAVLHLPLQWHLSNYYFATPPATPPFQHLLDHCQERYTTIALETKLEPAHADSSYWTASFHHGPELHRIVALTTADEIADCLLSGACPLRRFEDPATLLDADG